MTNEGRFKLDKRKFSNGSMRCFISLLLITLGTSGNGCMETKLSMAPPYRRLGFSYNAVIEPLPTNYGRWSKEEIYVVIDAIATVAERYGFEKSKHDEGYALSHEKYNMQIWAWVTVMGEHYLLRAKSSSLSKDSPFTRKLDLEIAIWSIFLRLDYLPREYYVPVPPLLGKLWNETVDTLRNKLGEERIKDRGLSD